MKYNGKIKIKKYTRLKQNVGIRKRTWESIFKIIDFLKINKFKNNILNIKLIK